MLFKTPKFWYSKSLYSTLLLPLSWIYLLVFFIKKLLTKSESLGKKTITIGNLTAGGSGKTPTACMVAKILQEMNFKVCFLNKGFQGETKGPLKVDLNIHNAKLVGDEAMILANYAECFVSYDRIKAKTLIKDSDANYVIQDDGYQNHHIKHDVKILVIDSNYLFGNERVIPAGPLRTPIKYGINQADLIILIGDFPASKEYLLQKNNDNIFKAKITAANKLDKNQSYLAFSGLAINQKFFNFLESEGYEVKETKEFPDHYQYQENDVMELIHLAEARQLQLVTTSKDYVKVSFALRSKINLLEINLEIENKELFSQKLVEKLAC